VPLDINVVVMTDPGVAVPQSVDEGESRCKTIELPIVEDRENVAAATDTRDKRCKMYMAILHKDARKVHMYTY